MELNSAELQKVVERKHRCKARLIQSVPVREQVNEAVVCDVVVHVFDLTGHPVVTRAYAWSLPIAGGDKQRVFAVLRQPPVNSPQEAVHAAVIHEQVR